MKKILLLIGVTFFCSIYESSAVTKADSVLALTGNKNTRFVWVRFPWAKDDYTPVAAYKAISLENEVPTTQLVTYTTDGNFTRYLDSTIGSHLFPRLTRKDGSQIVWHDAVNKCAWIRDFNCTKDKIKLIDGGDYLTVACQYNPVTGKEYIYTLSQSKQILYRIEFNTNYTLNTATKTTIYSSDDLHQFAMPVSVSEDGKYLGGEMPWPNPEIFDIANNNHLSRRWPGGVWGCEPNLAPDNSYRFYHLHDNHQDVSMWDQGLSETNWTVNISNAMPGNTLNHDCSGPRWSNNVRFFTNSFPLQSGFQDQYADNFFPMSAAQVKVADASKAGSFCLGKFSADFKSVEGYVKISDGDVRHRDVIGDAWIANSIDKTAPSIPTGLAGTPLSESKISLSWIAATDAESGILEYSIFRNNTKIGVTGETSYVDSGLTEATTYQYSIAAVNGASMVSAQTSAVSVKSQNDTRKPTILSATALSKPNQVMIVFSEPVSKASAETGGNYSLGSGFTITTASLPDGISTVILTLNASLTKGTSYTVTVNNVADKAITPNMIVANSTATFTYFPCGDDFEGSTMNASTWTVVNTFAGSVKQGNGHLYIKTDGESYISRNQFYGVKRTDFTGDFDVWVKIINSNVAPIATQQGIISANNLSTLTAGGNVTVGLEYYNDQAVSSSLGNSAYVMRYSKATTGVLDNQMELHSNKTLPCWLRLVKKGTTYTGYASSIGPNNWMLIGSATVLGAAARADVGLFGSSQSGQPWGSHAFFDEFGCTVDGQGLIPTGVVSSLVKTPAQSHFQCVVSKKHVTVTSFEFPIKSCILVSPSGRVVVSSQNNNAKKVMLAIPAHAKGLFFIVAKGEGRSLRESVLIQ